MRYICIYVRITPYQYRYLYILSIQGTGTHRYHFAFSPSPSSPLSLPLSLSSIFSPCAPVYRCICSSAYLPPVDVLSDPQIHRSTSTQILTSYIFALLLHVRITLLRPSVTATYTHTPANCTLREVNRSWRPNSIRLTHLLRKNESLF